MNNIVECKNLTKMFDTKKALDNVTLSISRGKIVGLLGPNASGKNHLYQALQPAFDSHGRRNIYRGHKTRH